MLEHVPVTPYMKNLYVAKVMADNESKFIKYVVMPFWRLMNTFFDGQFDFAVDFLETNENKWLEIIKQEELKEKQKLVDKEEHKEEKETDLIIEKPIIIIKKVEPKGIPEKKDTEEKEEEKEEYLNKKG